MEILVQLHIQYKVKLYIRMDSDSVLITHVEFWEISSNVSQQEKVGICLAYSQHISKLLDQDRMVQNSSSVNLKNKNIALKYGSSNLNPNNYKCTDCVNAWDCYCRQSKSKNLSYKEVVS